jgi:hypothetical protein
MDEKRKKWLLIAKELIKNPHSEILCIDCNLASLYIKDVFLDNKKLEKDFERHIFCHNCGYRDSILIRKLLN